MKSGKKFIWDAQNIKTLRTHLGLTQDALSEQLGTRQQTISEWERGMYCPRGASAKLLSIIAEKANFSYQVEYQTHKTPKKSEHK